MGSPEIPVEPPPGAEHKLLRAAFDYWRGKAPPGGLPGRQHLDPIEMKPFLPHVVLFDVEGDREQPRFRIRLEGSVIVEALGRDATGRMVGEAIGIDDARMVRIIERMTRLVQTREPYVTTDEVAVPGRDHITVRRLILPLASDGRNVDMLLACCIVEQAPRQTTPKQP